MIKFDIGDTVRIADIADPPFPSRIGQTGTVRAVVTNTDIDPSHDIYEVVIDGIPYACWGNEIEMVVDADGWTPDGYNNAYQRVDTD